MTGVNPSSTEASRRMARQRQRNTQTELGLRRALHARGLRYRLQVPLLAKPRREADIFFPGSRVAVFVDGCFWHGCPPHATWPKENVDFWRAQIEANRAHDTDRDSRMKALGWQAVRVWAHEFATEAAELIVRFVSNRMHVGSSAAAPSNLLLRGRS